MGSSSSRPLQRVLLLGLDGAGKSSIVARLHGEEARTLAPSLGVSISLVTVGGIEVELIDVGGRKEIRRYWPAHAARLGRGAARVAQESGGSVETVKKAGSRSAILYVIDGADRRRLIEAAKELHAVLSAPELRGVPLLVAANKQDRAGALSAADLEAAMHLHSIRDRPWRCVGSSALRGDGLREALEWLAHDQSYASTTTHDSASAPGAVRNSIFGAVKRRGTGRGVGRSRRRRDSGEEEEEEEEEAHLVDSSEEEAEPANSRVSSRAARRTGRPGSRTESGVEDADAHSSIEQAPPDTDNTEQGGRARRRERRSAAQPADEYVIGQSDTGGVAVTAAASQGEAQADSQQPNAERRRRRRGSARTGEEATE